MTTGNRRRVARQSEAGEEGDAEACLRAAGERGEEAPLGVGGQGGAQHLGVRGERPDRRSGSAAADDEQCRTAGLEVLSSWRRNHPLSLSATARASGHDGADGGEQHGPAAAAPTPHRPQPAGGADGCQPHRLYRVRPGRRRGGRPAPPHPAGARLPVELGAAGARLLGQLPASEPGPPAPS